MGIEKINDRERLAISLRRDIQGVRLCLIGFTNDVVDYVPGRFLGAHEGITAKNDAKYQERTKICHIANVRHPVEFQHAATIGCPLNARMANDVK